LSTWYINGGNSIFTSEKIPAMKKLLFTAALALCSISSFAQTAAVEKYDPIRVCIIKDDALTEILAYYDNKTGATYVDRDGKLVKLDEAFPAGDVYTANKTWYINSDEIKCLGKTYVKYGLPRVLGVNEIEKVGVYDKVNVYAEPNADDAPEVIYLPVRAGCEFQPYQVLYEDSKIQESRKAPSATRKAKSGK
jgi:hypothetical protein